MRISSVDDLMLPKVLEEHCEEERGRLSVPGTLTGPTHVVLARGRD